MNRFFQALNNADLVALNRDHDVDVGIEMVKTALALTSSVSIDLIFGRPKSSLDDWRKELEQAQDLFPSLRHISLYQLTLERG